MRRGEWENVKFTKLVPPAVLASSVPRPRLEAIADELLEAPVGLVVASAGFGKSTLLTAWHARLAPQAKTAWLSLEARDASVSAFADALQSTLCHAMPQMGRSVAALVDDGCADAATLAVALVNEIFVATEEASEDLVLFVDDVHLACEAGEGAALLSGLLSQLPRRLHVVLASRRPLSFSPLAKLRSSGRLREVRESDLRFTLDEACALVGDADAARHLIERTDGWPMAFRLTSALFAAGNRNLEEIVGTAREAVFQFLAEEVVGGLPARMREQLHILALPPTLDPVTARFLLELDQPDAVLERVAAQGLYLSRDGSGYWRFHQLFREFLLRRFRVENPKAEREQRRRYARLLRERGESLDAVSQLIEAGDYLEIARFLQEALITIRFTERYRQVLDLLAQVPDEVKRRTPMLFRFQALALQRIGNYADANVQLGRCYESARAEGDDAAACTALLELGIAAGNFRFQGHGDFAESERYFQSALQLAGGERLHQQAGYAKVAHVCLGMALAARFAYDEALEHLEIAERMELADRHHGELTLIAKATVHGWLGDWREALACAEVAEELFRTDAEFQIGHALAMQARAHLHLRENVSKAMELATRAIEAFHKFRLDEELAGAYVLFAKCALADDPPDVQAARAAGERAERLANPLDPVLRFDLRSLRAELALATGASRDAQALCDEISAAALASGDAWQSARSLLLRARVARAASRDDDALAAFDKAARLFAQARDAYHATSARISALAIAARQGRLDANDMREFLQALQTTRQTYVALSAPRDAGTLLAWSLRHAVEIERAEHAFGQLEVEGIDEIAAVAEDAAVPEASRATAIRVLARCAGTTYAALLTRLARDTEPAVASQAAAVLNLLPGIGIPTLHVEAIDELRVRIGEAAFGEDDVRWTRRKAAELLRYLALSSGPVTKTRAVGALWPDASTGGDAGLRVALHALRQALQPGCDGAGDYVEMSSITIGLRRDRFAGTDVDEARANLQRGKLLLARGDLEGARKALERAADAFEKAPREDLVAPWLAPFARQWRAAAVDAFRSLALARSLQGRNDEAVAAARRAIALDPLDEETVCALLDIFAEHGNLEAARSAFLAYRKRLMESLETTPGQPVLDRYSKILARIKHVDHAQLSAREFEVLGLVARGMSNKQIAGELSLSYWTVGNHLARIFKKLKLDNRAAAASFFVERFAEERAERA
ncbi:MAG: LuxR C-terminal-related transcriptional regulator [Vulcanimicrobiaceae bacterium]